MYLYYYDMTANADIYFDDTLAFLLFNENDQPVLLQRRVLALLKWIDRGEALSLHLRSDSQDAWIFEPPLHQQVLDRSDFHMGVTRCDNRLVDIFETSGHDVVNPAFAIHAIEIQNTMRVGVLYNIKGSVPGDVKNIFLTDLHQF